MNIVLGSLVRVKINSGAKEFWSKKTDHDSIGVVWQKDDEHVWIKPILRNQEGIAYIGSPVRYPWFDIHIEHCDVGRGSEE